MLGRAEQTPGTGSQCAVNHNGLISHFHAMLEPYLIDHRDGPTETRTEQHAGGEGGGILAPYIL